MKKLIFAFIASFCIVSMTAQVEEPQLQELLSRLSENHMGSISDVFSPEEIEVLKNHFHSESIPIVAENSLLTRRARSTQAVAPIAVVEIDPTDLSDITNLGLPGTVEFEGAGATFVNQGRSYIIDNVNRVFIRDMTSVQYQDTGVNIGTLPNEVLTGIEVLSDGNMYGIGTNGVNSSHLYHINTNTWQATVVGPNNGLVLPINLARNAVDDLVTIDIDDDITYSINRVSGVITPKGSIGFDANFGQGMGYDEASDEILLTAFNNSSFVSELRRLNFDTGLTTNLGTIVPGETYQFGWASFFDKDLLGVNEIRDDEFNFYPNPASDGITLGANQLIERASIFNVLGKKVFSQEINATNARMNIDHLNSGIYILKVVINGNESTYKFVKL